jgi:RimJ/RimL family protein N-acetyltransferase
MRAPTELRTERLLLRRWRAADRDPFAAINGDPAVMEHFPATLSRTESDVLIARMEDCLETNGYGLWAVELPGVEPLVGFVGLTPVDIDVAFAPAVEIGWRLARGWWGQGIATEAAGAVVAFAFQQLRLPGLVSYTAAVNTRSRRVMERLGMTRDPVEDFPHPAVEEGHRLSPHVLYRLDGGGWEPGAPIAGRASPAG